MQDEPADSGVGIASTSSSSQADPIEKSKKEEAKPVLKPWSTNGMILKDWSAIVLSGCAFIVSFLSFYFSNVRQVNDLRLILGDQQPITMIVKDGANLDAMRGREALDPGLGASAGLSEVAQWPRLDRPEPRLQAAWHHNIVCGARSRHRKDHRRRRVEFLDFMNSVTAAFPGRKLHVILDNLNTHKKNEHWLKAHPNVQFHFTPTSASWLNQVEVWFSILQGQSLSGTSFTSLKQLQEHIDAYVNAYNDKAQPFVWTKKKVRQRRFKGRRITQL
jgi:transposase